MLPTHQTQTISLLPDAEQVIVKAKFAEPKAVDLKPNDAQNKIATLITNLLADAGYNDSKDEHVIIHLTTRVYEDMLTRYKHLTLGELKIALNEGVRGNYSEFKGINITTISFWIKSFEASEYRKNSLLHFNKLLGLQTPRPQPSEAEKETLLQKACADAYNDFLAGKDFTLIAKTIYDYLKAKHNIVWSDAERIEIKNIAADNYERSLLLKKRARQITYQQFEIALKGQPNLNLEMKRVALLFYFKRLREEGRGLGF
jgi:hypothetical protein